MAARPRKADIIRDRIVNLAHDETSGWEPVPGLAGLTIRHTDEHETHPANLGEGFGRWPEPTYHSHTFVTLVAGKVILGYSAAPWMSRNDSDIPFWLAEAILGDHTLAGDYTRINAMRDARKKGRA
jgi:hypothetical protein